MRKDLDEKLCKEFPLLYRDRHGDKSKTCMCWGFSCSDGWFQLIYDLSAKLEPLIAAQHEDCSCGHSIFEHADGDCLGVYADGDACVCSEYLDGRLRASQVKEKFGGLRFYTDGVSTSEIETLIDTAEELSTVTCEICGQPGVYRGDRSWVLTLCDEHSKIESKRLFDPEFMKTIEHLKS